MPGYAVYAILRQFYHTLRSHSACKETYKEIQIEYCRGSASSLRRIIQIGIGEVWWYDSIDSRSITHSQAV